MRDLHKVCAQNLQKSVHYTRGQNLRMYSSLLHDYASNATCCTYLSACENLCTMGTWPTTKTANSYKFFAYIWVWFDMLHVPQCARETVYALWARAPQRQHICLFACISLLHIGLIWHVARTSMHERTCAPWAQTTKPAYIYICLFCMYMVLIWCMGRHSEHERNFVLWARAPTTKPANIAPHIWKFLMMTSLGNWVTCMYIHTCM